VKKIQTWTFAFFSSSQPTATAVGCSSPFEPLITGLRLERP
jgi:hypothetical protein